MRHAVARRRAGGNSLQLRAAAAFSAAAPPGNLHIPSGRAPSEGGRERSRFHRPAVPGLCIADCRQTPKSRCRVNCRSLSGQAAAPATATAPKPLENQGIHTLPGRSRLRLRARAMTEDEAKFRWNVEKALNFGRAELAAERAAA